MNQDEEMTLLHAIRAGLIEAGLEEHRFSVKSHGMGVTPHAWVWYEAPGHTWKLKIVQDQLRAEERARNFQPSRPPDRVFDLADPGMFTRLAVLMRDS